MTAQLNLITQQNNPALMPFLVFGVGQHEYALRIEAVVEVVRMVALVPVPEAPAALAGLLNLRGEIIPVVNVGVRLGVSRPDIKLNARIIVVGLKQRRLGLIVDTVQDVLSVSAKMVTQPDDLADSSPVAATITRSNGRIVLVLDPTRLVGAKMISVAENLSGGRQR